jgi:hypothetical protein
MNNFWRAKNDYITQKLAPHESLPITLYIRKLISVILQAIISALITKLML